MDLQEKLKLVSRNAVEIVTLQEVEKILSEKKQPTTYCGYEPSGEMHLGHLSTAVKLMDLEKAGFKVKVLLADWHAWLNQKGDWNFIKEQTKIWSKAFQKIGLKNAEFLQGTSYQKKIEFIDDVVLLSNITTINRGLRSMQEIARNIENAKISQVIYPLMQVCDVKHLKVDAATAGIDQRKVYMLGREVIEKIGYKKFAIVSTPMMTSLQGSGSKMSSSVPSTLISVRDSEQAIKEKLGKAFCQEGIVENNPVLEIAKLIVMPLKEKLEVKRQEKFGGNAEFADYNELEKAFASKQLHPLDLKNAVAESLIEILNPVRKEFK